jgi:hypothetical protein
MVTSTAEAVPPFQGAAMFVAVTRPAPVGNHASHGLAGGLAVVIWLGGAEAGLESEEGAADGESVAASGKGVTAATFCGAAPRRIIESGA